MNFAALLALLAATIFSYVSAQVSQGQFNAAATKNDFPTPSIEIYNLFVKIGAKYPQAEQAMFLAQMLYESSGFQFTEELLCKGNKCKTEYVDNVGLRNKQYYGRGYLQLTWGSNYKKASQALGLGDLLLREPELVASNKRYAMLVSSWYWDTRVRPLLGSSNQFGRTTQGINGGECKYTKYYERAQKRWKIYVNVAAAFNIKQAQETGCYN